MGNIETSISMPSSENARKLTPSYDVLEIVGNAGTGTTSTGLALAELHGARFLSIGDIVGKINKGLWNGRLLEDGRELDAAIDKKMDRLGEIIIQNSKQRGPLIVDSRMGGYIAAAGAKKAQKEDKSYPKVVKILITADVTTRAQRVAKRENQPVEDIRRMTIRRDERDEKVFENALPPELKGLSRDEIYDLIIDNSGMTVDDTIIRINTYLRNNGYLS